MPTSTTPRLAGVHPEARDENNIPVGCPLDEQAMLQFALDHLEEDVEFNPCLDCAFFSVVRLDVHGNMPTRSGGDWYDYGLCVAPGRAEPTLVVKRRVSGQARKVVLDDPYETDSLVLDCIDDGVVVVREIVAETGLAERTVFKVLARLRHSGVLAMGSPIRRADHGQPARRSAPLKAVEAVLNG